MLFNSGNVETEKRKKMSRMTKKSPDKENGKNISNAFERTRFYFFKVKRKNVRLLTFSSRKAKLIYQSSLAALIEQSRISPAVIKQYSLAVLI